MRTTVEPSPTPSFRTQRRDSDDPSEELGAPQPTDQDMNNLMNQTFASMFGGVAGIPGSEGMGFNPAALLGAMNGGGGGGDNEAFQKLLQGQQGDSNAPPFDPSALFGGGGSQQKVDPSTKYWNLLHLILMMLLGIYAVYTEWTRGGSERFASLLYSNVGVSNYPSIHVVSVFIRIMCIVGLILTYFSLCSGTL